MSLCGWGEGGKAGGLSYLDPCYSIITVDHYQKYLYMSLCLNREILEDRDAVELPLCFPVIPTQGFAYSRHSAIVL